MNNVLSKILKAFGIIVTVTVITGLFTVSIYKNTLDYVSIYKLPIKHEIKSMIQQYDIKGTVIPKNYIEIYANSDVLIENIDVKQNQIIKKNGLFSLKSTDGKYLNLSSINVKSPNEKDDIKNLSINNNNQIQSEKQICIDYITEYKEIFSGDLIARYYYYDENLMIEATVDSKLAKYIEENKTPIGIKDNDVIKLDIISTKKFTDHKIYDLQVANNKINTLTPFDEMNLSTSETIKCDLIVDKSVVLPATDFTIGASGVVYFVKCEDTILGKQYIVSEQRCIIRAIGEYDVGIDLIESKISDETEVSLISYPTTKLQENMRVRIK